MAIRNVCREFIVLCRRLNLFSAAIVAIDGSKFKAVNNRDSNFTQAQEANDALEERIDRYLASSTVRIVSRPDPNAECRG